MMDVLDAIVKEEDIPPTTVSNEGDRPDGDGTFPYFKAILEGMSDMKLFADGSVTFLHESFRGMVGFIDSTGVVSLVTNNSVTSAVGTAASIGLYGALKMWRYDMAQAARASDILHLPGTVIIRQMGTNSFRNWFDPANDARHSIPL